MRKAAPSSLRRIVVRQSLIALGALILAYSWLYVQVRLTSDNLRENTLFDQAQDIIAALQMDDDGHVTLTLPQMLTDNYGLSDGRYRYAVRNASKAIITDSGWTVGRLPIVDVDDEDGEIYEHGPDRQSNAKLYCVGR